MPWVNELKARGEGHSSTVGCWKKGSIARLSFRSCCYAFHVFSHFHTFSEWFACRFCNSGEVTGKGLELDPTIGTWDILQLPADMTARCDINGYTTTNNFTKPALGSVQSMWICRSKLIFGAADAKPIGCTIPDGRACKDQQQMPPSCIVICMLHASVRLKSDRLLTWGLPSCAAVGCYGMQFSIFNYYHED